MPLQFSIPKVNAGQVNQRGKHNLSHNVATSFDFGRVQPVFCKLVTPDSHIKGSLDAKIRVMPMPLPPFGALNMKLYGQFVSCKELMHSFPEFISGQVYSSSSTSYVPKHVPRLFNYINPITFDKVNFAQQVTFAHILSCPKFSTWTAYAVKGGYAHVGTQEISNISVVNLVDDLGGFTDNQASIITEGLNILCFNKDPKHSEPLQQSGDFMFSTFNFTHFEQSIDTVTSVKPSIDSPVGSLEYATSLGYNYTPTGADLLFVIPYSRIKDNASLSSAFKTAINAKVQNNSNTSVVVAVSFNQYGRNLLTILKHLGINVNGFNTQESVEETRKYVSLMPLFAFYKAYFDIFMPTRDIQWSSTNAHRILDFLNQSGKEISDLYNDYAASSYVSGKTFTSFLFDVSSAYASVDPNYITQAVDNTTPTASVSSSVSDKMSGTEAESNLNSVLPAQYDTATSSNVISRVGLQLLTRLSKFVNTNTVIGRNVNAFLKAHFGAIGTSENSQYCGSSDVPINLGDVIVTANTELSQPGDFSGVGFGSGDYNFSYKANEFGYFIVLASIIPVSNYVQGEHYDNSITERFEFPSPEFDALGYDYLDSREIVPVPMALPYGFVRTSESTEKPVSTNFGYSPRYTGYKVHPSVYSGSFQIRSLRNSYLGFTLDNYITQDYVTQHGNNYYIEGPLDLTCGTRWRFVNKYPMFSNYERIFYNQRVNPFLTMDSLYDTTYSKNILAVPYEDNFVAYFDVKCSLVDHLKSISNSYDTLEGSDFYVNKQ